MRTLIFTLLVLVLVLLALPMAAAAQEGEDEGGGEWELPPLARDLVIGGFFVGPLIMLIVQAAKRAGLPDGAAGQLALGLSVVAVVLAVLAGWFHIETRVADMLQLTEQIALLALRIFEVFGLSVATYKLANSAELVKPRSP